MSSSLRQVLACTLLLASVGPASAVIDLAPTPAEITAHGIVYKQLKFKDGQRRVTMDLPNRWSYRGSPTRLQLTPSDKNFAEGVIEVTPLPPPPNAAPVAPGEEPPPQPVDEAAMQAFEQRAIADLPPGSQFVGVVSRSQPQVWPGKPMFEIVLTYKALGETFRRSITFVNLSDSRLTLRVSAKEKEFGQVESDFHRAALSLTWQ